MLERLGEMDALSFFCIVVLFLFSVVAHGGGEEKVDRGPYKVLFSKIYFVQQNVILFSKYWTC